MGIRSLGSFYYLRLSCVLFTIRNVVPDAPSKKSWLLPYKSYVFSQRLQIETPYVFAIYEYLSFQRIVESLYQSNDGGLTTPALSHQRHTAPCNDFKREISQDHGI